MGEWPRLERDIHYSDDSQLNTLQICLPRPPSADDERRVWVVYVHGGAWCDPTQTASTFDAAQSIVLKSSSVEHISGFASINYRLSPAPQHSTHPSHPDDPARNAHHPQHITDILRGLLYLQERYHFEERYVLVGHSCGATLALQVAMKRYWGAQYESTYALEMNVVPPLAIVGTEGIYDLPAMIKWHADQPYYRHFVERAFGPREDDWKTVSPTISNFKNTWTEGKLVVIAHSAEDELVEMEQPDLMVKSLQEQHFSETGDRLVKRLSLHGLHDSVWENGVGVASSVEYAVQVLMDMS